MRNIKDVGLTAMFLLVLMLGVANVAAQGTAPAVAETVASVVGDGETRHTLQPCNDGQSFSVSVVVPNGVTLTAREIATTEVSQLLESGALSSDDVQEFVEVQNQDFNADRADIVSRSACAGNQPTTMVMSAVGADGDPITRLENAMQICFPAGVSDDLLQRWVAIDEVQAIAPDETSGRWATPGPTFSIGGERCVFSRSVSIFALIDVNQ